MKKQFCGYCSEDKCLLDCEICNPKLAKDVTVTVKVDIRLNILGEN